MTNIQFNPNVEILYGDANKTDTGALLTYSGSKTGRCPLAKRIVHDSNTLDIWWGKVNIPMSPELFTHYRTFAKNYLNEQQIVYQIDSLAAISSTQHTINIRTYTTSAYHALFMKTLFKESEIMFDEPDFTIYDVGEINLSSATKNIDPNIKVDDKLTSTLIGINFSSMEMLMYGTMYAGELKKSIFTLFMYLMPIYSNLPLHSSCNIKISEDVNPTIFFGLSGTGKTTLSADSSRGLIGDDEHVWSDDGIFNIESGCYAKCIDLSQKNEPEIFEAIKYGAILENVVTDNNFIPKYNDRSITDNTRCAYPLSYISNSIIPSITTHPTNIVMLTCDVTGLLPPIAKLDVEQAIYFFLNGYTSKMIGTEVAVTKTEQTFSACFGEPFLVWHPMKYGELLKQQILKHNPNIWLLNTGWITEIVDSTRQKHRISIKNSRNILDALYSGTLIKQEFITFPLFNFQIPLTCPNINSEILDPRINGETNYMLLLQELYDSFENNYKKLYS